MSIGKKYMGLFNVLLVALLVVLVVLFPLAQSVCASTLFEYYNTGDDSATLSYDNYWYAQTFTPSQAHTITSVKLLLYRGGSPGTVTVSIKATDGSGHPTGGDLCSGTTNGNTLTTSPTGEWREITLGAGYALADSTKYAIVVRAIDADISNYFYLRFDNSAATYIGGNYEVSNNSGSSWNKASNYDFMFEEYGDVIVTAPDITTTAASSVSGTTARINADVIDDGGEACEVRWGWGETSEAAIEDYDHYTAFAGSYTTGQKPYYDVDSLDVDTLYYFRVEIQNSEDTELGGELSFTTTSGVDNPTNFIAYPSATSISLTWTKGAGATSSIVRYRTDTFPASYTDGTLVYEGVSSSTTHTGLTAGRTYYYAVWGYSGAIYSSGSAEVMATTSAAVGGGDDFDAPSTPLRWLIGTDYTNMENLPVFYDTFNFTADTLDMPRATVWFIIFMTIGLVFGAIVYFISEGSVTIALIGLTIAYVGFYVMEQIPLAIPVLLAIILAAIFFVKRREAV
jgi:hypothetical protein